MINWPDFSSMWIEPSLSIKPLNQPLLRVKALGSKRFILYFTHTLFNWSILAGFLIKPLTSLIKFIKPLGFSNLYFNALDPEIGLI